MVLLLQEISDFQAQDKKVSIFFFNRNTSTLIGAQALGDFGDMGVTGCMPSGSFRSA